MSRRVICVNPPGLPGTTANREGAGGMGNVYSQSGAFLYPPHMLAATAGALREGGLEVSARDCVLEGDSLAQAVTWAEAQQPTWVVVQVSWATWDPDEAFLRAARAALPDASVVAVGASVTHMESALSQIPGIAWLRGEPERLLGVFVANLGADTARWAGPLSLSMLSGPGLPDAQRLERLEGLPHPAWDLFPWRRYGMLTVVGSKGCGYACTYCPYIVAQGRKFRPRPIGETVDELAWLAAEFKLTRVVFRDPVFGYDRGRVLSLCKEIKRRGVHLSWECESRADDLDGELVAAMAKAGCATVKLGLESADADVLVAVRRVRDAAGAEVYRSRSLAAAAACKQHGVACRVFAMTGLPGETDRSVAETASLIREIQPAGLQVKRVDWPTGRPADANIGEGAEERAKRLRDAWQPAQSPAKTSLLARVKGRLSR